MTQKTQFLLVFIFSLFIYSCSSTETITVQTEAQTVTADRTEDGDNDEIEVDPVTQLTIGENELIRSMDPLFAHNTTSQRAIYITYDRLTRLDASGNILPSIARSWEVSDDSLTYTFNLRTDAFYHDSNIFSSGLGRVVRANDVKFAFERMSQSNVPQDAALMFTDIIKGFDAFRVQQQNLFFADERIFSSITGIEAVNDSTVSFSLNAPHEYFTRLLAHPYTSIYPSEALERDRGLHASPLGSGIFKFSHTEGDSIYVFARNDSYFQNDLFSSRYRSLRFVSFKDEGRLFRMLSSGDVHFLPETGPQTIITTTTDSGALKPGYDDFLHLAPTGAKEIYLYHLPDNFSGIDYKSLEDVANVMLSQELATKLENKFIVDFHISEESIISGSQHELKIGFERTPHVSYVSQVVAGLMSDTPKSLYPVRTPNRDLALLWSTKKLNSKDANVIGTFRYNSFSLIRTDYEGIQVSENPWWFGL